MYVNNGDSSKNIPAHWHYVSFGLSDLHGDGRVHEYVNIGHLLVLFEPSCSTVFSKLS